ncbi:hypothetical protein MtrunA17_Chr4g0076841 [Medicago truncatula]|uniref:Uncharacterized protein n=1 Tax=Medicago truncatula TaxID=3880 RepID=A0A396IHV9_MEDTR|nr:hypothetical protein MtrunA17_Chr4g0076841 [Medicago truncatula]
MNSSRGGLGVCKLRERKELLLNLPEASVVSEGRRGVDDEANSALIRSVSRIRIS